MFHHSNSTATKDQQHHQPQLPHSQVSATTVVSETITVNEHSSLLGAGGATTVGAADHHHHWFSHLFHRSHLPQGAPIIPAHHHELHKDLIQAGGEFFGTFFFLFIGFGAIQASLLHKENFLQSISIAFGLGLTLSVWVTYRISGGALNPAVVFALFLLNKITPRKALFYVIGELLGATCAAFTIATIIPNAWGVKFLGANEVFAPVTYFQGFFIEFFLTAGLVLVVLFIAVDKSKATFIAPLLIGLYVYVAHLVSIPYTNTSLNPARTFGASVVTGVWTAHWLFWTGPLAGAAFGAGVWQLFKHFDYESLNIGQEDDHAPARLI